ncbi:MAG: hypothetical protein ACLPSW_08275 [Roseiarcus sp.]
MAHIFDDALSDDLVTVVTRNDSMGTFDVQIGELETIVTIDLGRFMDCDRTKFQLSHAIKTPIQAGPYRTSIPIADDPAYALHRAIKSLTDYYRDAVKRGHKPNEQWLVEN